ncbi:hypothetical protein N7468_010329 [Penicillium chermesinum]|uniref:Xylanolytic transcriptional activator regulatory domain-containing protein n=1 Tax=Penicillium chermesinum TaxID=63820 RepID=A0A9W9NCG4_9EURO|nr:uncharacterized protein N7468_010329 [Penicillium chermesinum]KAJ5217321.1 hypothetical protein N7468_010329 [Penicillium chermesinum]
MPSPRPSQTKRTSRYPILLDWGGGLGASLSQHASNLNAADLQQSLFPPATSIPNEPADTIPNTIPNVTTDFHWDLISLGLEEPLPAPEVVEELDNIFFEKVYPIMPIIHRPRYFANLNLAPGMRPPICLRYIMWCHAASVTDKYFSLHTHFYQRARKYAEMEEMKGFGESVVGLGFCQTWILVGAYEFRMIYFPRAWLSVGKATRLALMMGLNRLDGMGLDVKQAILPPKDWTEREERRRTFWMAFCTDRYASIGTGWPVVIDEQDIMTNLPASEESFEKSKPQRTLRLVDIVAGEGVSTLSPFACVVILSSLFGRNIIHLHRPQANDNDHDLNGEFWKRHRSHDNILLHIALSLPEHLRLPSGMDDVNVIFANMSIHTSTICLHQAAIFKSEKNKMPNQITTESKRRCLVAANQISSIMKMVSHVDLTLLNPFMSFCLYIAARVFVQYLKARPDDSSVFSSLQFVVGALNAMKVKNPLTESFLVQLDVDLEGVGIKAINPSKFNVAYALNAKKAFPPDPVECPPIFSMVAQNGRGLDGTKTGGSNQAANSTGINTSLPNRQRDSLNQICAYKVPQNDHMFPQSQNTAGYANSNGSLGATDIDMDFPADFGLGERNPPSDHPTPSTLNSSSNTSYAISGFDDPSPDRNPQKTTAGQSKQGLGTVFDKNQPVHISPASSGSPQIGGQSYPTNTTGPLTAGSGSAFNMPSVWDMPTPSADISNVDFGGVNVDGLSDAQWAQILSSSGNAAGWDSWRPS